MKYKIRIGEKEFEAEKKGSELTLAGKKAEFDLVQTAEREFHILKNNKSYVVEVADYNAETQEYVLVINGKKTQGMVQDEFALLLAGMGMQGGGAKKTRELKAPMPGLVGDVLVSAGQTIEKGQPLLILEAMKMENVLKAANDAIVKTVEVKKGNAVEKNQLLITFQ